MGVLTLTFLSSRYLKAMTLFFVQETSGRTAARLTRRSSGAPTSRSWTSERFASTKTTRS
jgi:hypothetical protein